MVKSRQIPLKDIIIRHPGPSHEHQGANRLPRVSAWPQQWLPRAGPGGLEGQNMIEHIGKDTNGVKTIVNHPFGNGLLPPIYNDLGHGLLLF